MSLKKFLLSKNYESVKLKRIATNHFQIKAKVNGVKGQFILDTGASNSCLGFDEIEKFSLDTAHSDHKAAGAGPEEIDTLISEDNTVKIGNFKLKKIDFVLIDLAHINKALVKHNAEAVNGIIGADILDSGKAVIDYHKKKLYLKN
ncbi:MAG: acid protease [Flavobacteriales bacterium]|nr:MAG: acid protease [Flavobacteriales bacterium]